MGKKSSRTKEDSSAPDSPKTAHVGALPGSLAPIASPLADEKLKKRIMKLVRRSSKDRQLKRGVKEVVKCLRKGTKGVVILAGDISPIDVLSHVPVMCEDAGVPYVYVPSKAELGLAGATKRPTSCILVTSPKSDSENRELYDKCFAEMKAIAA